MSRLKIAEDLSLPIDIVTQTIAILAKRRAGKSYTMRRLIEQLFKAGQQVVIVDPKGDQWGLRSAANGKDPGLPIVILGGERGDVPLEASSGEVVAKLVVEERVSVLLDLSLFRKHEVATFMTAFMENLYRLKAREIYRTPMMLVIDEADAVAPQKPQKGEERMLGAAEDIVRRGGQRGIGCVLVTQRSAVLNKNVLTQAQVLIVLRTIAPQDLAAMDAWIDVHGEADQRRTLMSSLPSLPVGDAWFWSPGWPTVDGIFKRVHVLPIETFDSGASPKPGVKPVEPKNLADVDLDALKGQMAATIEKAKADDPKVLRAEIGRLNAQVKRLNDDVSKAGNNITAEKRVEVLTDADRAVLTKLADGIGNIRAFLQDGHVGLVEEAKHRLSLALDTFIEDSKADVERMRAEFERRLDAKGFQKILGKLAHVETRPNYSKNIPQTPQVGSGGRIAPRPAMPRPNARADSPSSNGAVKGGAFRSMLVALAQAEKPLADYQLSARAGMALSGTFDKYLGMQRTEGWVVGDRNALSITDEGILALGAYEPLPSGSDLQQYWLNKLGGGKKRDMLAVLIEAYPQTLSDSDVADRAGMALSGTFDKYLGQLRSLMLVEGTRLALKASEELFT